LLRGLEIKGEHSRPGCDSPRPRGEFFGADLARRCDLKRNCADDEGVVGCARGGRAPHSTIRNPNAAGETGGLVAPKSDEGGRVASRKAGEDGLVASKRSEDGRELIS